MSLRTATNRTCQRTVLALPWLLNGSLAAEERRQVREHLIGCPACRAELARTRETIALFGGVERAAGAATARAGAAAGANSGRRTASGTVLRRREWAAAAAILALSVGVLWVARPNPVVETASAVPAAPAPVERPAAPTPPAPPATVAEAEGMEDPANAAASAPRAENGTARPPAPRVARPHEEQLATRLPAAAAVVIASTSFESGDLGEWH
jgi:hypothetical protein